MKLPATGFSVVNKRIFVMTSLRVTAQSCKDDEILYFPDSQQCDKYTQCKYGVVTEEYCPPGLLFNDKITNGRYPCDYPIDVDCGSRTRTQPPVPSEGCPNAWGYYGSGDRAQCSYFFNCVDGNAFQFNCPEGLAFSSATYRCEWPDESPDCDSAAFLGFSCPEQADLSQILLYGHARLRSPRDCRQFFICVGASPRMNSCELGTVFNEDANNCDEPENVRGCENYYPADELAAIRERRERSRLAEAKRKEEFEQLRLQLASRRN
ncbi:Chitin-binding domain type 2 [Halocaridina rubra]|uniref:Chitin-binding domain type 2 n=1 Tax=Halocaridina rubra TaxID=373956 RepID=A0AAN9AFU6_HALRR